MKWKPALFAILYWGTIEVFIINRANRDSQAMTDPAAHGVNVEGKVGLFMFRTHLNILPSAVVVFLTILLVWVMMNKKVRKGSEPGDIPTE